MIRSLSGTERRGRSISFLLVTAILAAGCATTPNEQGTEPDDLPRSQAPDDYSYLDENGTSGPHVHDYWDGQTAMELYSLDGKEIDIDPRSGKGSQAVQAPAGKTVLPGTGWINITIRWESGDALEKTLFLEWVSRNTSYRERIGPLSHDQDISIPTNESMNDLPHTSTTRWVMTLRAEGPGGSVRVWYTATAMRVPGDLPISPPHPEFWANRTAITAFEVNGTFKSKTHPVDGGHFPPPRVLNREGYLAQAPIVPPSTGFVSLTVFYNASSDPSGHYRPTLYVSGADRRSIDGVDEPTESRIAQANGFYRWHIPASPNSWDSPYDNQTQWVYSISWAEVDQVPPPAVEGTYELRLVVHTIAFELKAGGSQAASLDILDRKRTKTRGVPPMPMARPKKSAGPSTAAVVREYIDTHPSIKDCLSDGLLNLSALSRKIMDERGITGHEATLVACRRYQDQAPKHSEREIRKTLAKSRVEMTTKMAIVTIRNDWQLYGRLQSILRRAMAEGHLPKLIQGSKAITLITDDRTAQDVQQELGGERILDMRTDLVEISVTSPESIRTTPGIMSYLCGALSSNGINVLETMSTYTDTIFIVHGPDMMRAFEILNQGIQG